MMFVEEGTGDLQTLMALHVQVCCFHGVFCFGSISEVIPNPSDARFRLQAVPEHLRKSSNKKSEEMLSNQMLSGIPEIDLGIE